MEIFAVIMIVVLLHFGYLFLIHLKTYSKERHTRILFSSEIATCIANKALLWMIRFTHSLSEHIHKDPSTDYVFYFPCLPSSWHLSALKLETGRTACRCGIGDQLFLWASSHHPVACFELITALSQGRSFYFGLCQIPLVSSWWYVISILIPLIC